MAASGFLGKSVHRKSDFKKDILRQTLNGQELFDPIYEKNPDACFLFGFFPRAEP